MPQERPPIQRAPGNCAWYTKLSCAQVAHLYMLLLGSRALPQQQHLRLLYESKFQGCNVCTQSTWTNCGLKTSGIKLTASSSIGAQRKVRILSMC